MHYFINPQGTQEQKLEHFKQLFKAMTLDGGFPPERHRAMYELCEQAGLDWPTARAFVRAEATALLLRAATIRVVGRVATDEDLRELRSIQRRLGLTTNDLKQATGRLHLPPVQATLAPQAVLPKVAPQAEQRPPLPPKLRGLMRAGVFLLLLISIWVFVLVLVSISGSAWTLAPLVGLMIALFLTTLLVHWVNQQFS